jgi:hypothetical protein
VAIGPAPVLAVLVGLFHTSLYVFIRGSVSLRVVVIGAAAILGAWAGDALGGRLGSDPIRVGDFHVVAASVMAWAGIAVMSVASVLGAPKPEEPEV